MHKNPQVFKVNTIVHTISRMRKEAVEDEDSRYSYTQPINNLYSGDQYCVNIAN